MSLPAPNKSKGKTTCAPDYLLFNHPRTLKSLLTASGLCIVALAPCTWRTKTQYESNGWIRLGRFLVTAITHIPRRQTFLLEKDLCANYPLIFLPHPEPHTSCTRQLGGWGGQEGLLSVVPSKDLCPFTPSFWSTAFSLAGGGYATLLIWISFWFLLLSQEGQSRVQLVHLHLGVPDTT